MMTSLDYARAACETMMRTYAPTDLPPKQLFHYHQGVFLSGMYETWLLSNDESYIDYIKAWVDSVFDSDGKILKYTRGELDDIQPGILLFRLLDYTKDPFYERCLHSVYESVQAIPRNPEGGYWHKIRLKDQMWLDGLYMAGPFCAEYAKRYRMPDLANDVVHQALLMQEKTRDATTGLLYHAWDGTHESLWCDLETGRSSEFWGRAMGWVPIALLNDLDFLPDNQRGREQLITMCINLLKALCQYQSDDGRWYQVVNKGGMSGNWLENSCSCLYIAALCKAMRKGYLPESYGQHAIRGYEGVIRSIHMNNEGIQIGNVCVGTSVGDYSYYCDRPVSVNDLHGVGAFLLMCTEMEKWRN